MQLRMIDAPLQSKPYAATQGSTRTLAEHLKVGATTVRRV
jgi:hypothetical protein